MLVRNLVGLFGEVFGADFVLEDLLPAQVVGGEQRAQLGQAEVQPLGGRGQ